MLLKTTQQFFFRNIFKTILFIAKALLINLCLFSNLQASEINNCAQQLEKIDTSLTKTRETIKREFISNNDFPENFLDKVKELEKERIDQAIEELERLSVQNKESGSTIDFFDLKQRLSLNSFKLGRYKKGLSYANEALAFAELSNSDGYKAIALSRIGVNLSKLGDLQESLSCHQESFGLLENIPKEEGNYTSHYSWEAINLGRLYKTLGDFSKAQLFFDFGLNGFKSIKEGKEAYVDFYLNALAEKISLSLEMEDFILTEELVSTYQAERKQVRLTPIYEADARITLARFHIHKQEYSLAINELTLADSLIEKLPNYYLKPVVQSLLSKIAYEQGNLERAYKLSARSINMISSASRQSYKLGQDNKGVKRSNLEVYSNHFFINVDANKRQKKATFLALQELMISDFNEKMNFLIEEGVEIRNTRNLETLKKINQKQKRCNEFYLMSKEAYGGPREYFESINKQSKDCQKELEVLKESRKLKDQIEDFLYPKSLNLEVIQKNLSSKEALIAFALFKENAYVWAITKEDLFFNKINKSKQELMDIVLQIKNTLIFDDPQNKLIPFNKQASHELFKILFSELLVNLGHVDNLIILKDSSFLDIPFSVLITNNKNWLIQEYGLRSIYHPAHLQLGTTKKAILDGDSFYGFGDPVSKDGFPKLEGSRKELESIAKAMSARYTQLYLGHNSTVNNLKKIQNSSQVLAFATHAVLPYEVKEISHPALLLDDWLTSKEIAFNFELTPQIVLLSACNTAGKRLNNKAPILDLPSSFMFSGARTVIATNWNIEDQVTKDIMNVVADYIYKNIEEEGVVTEALRKGMQGYINKNKYAEKFSLNDGIKIDRTHPYFWASFEVIGSR